MALPKSVKIKKNGVEYLNNVDVVQYTMKELIRCALRDTGRFICNRTRQKARKQTGVTKKGIQYWVRSKKATPDLQVGYKPIAWKGLFYELGSSRHPKEGWLYNSTLENIGEIQKIQAQYLSALSEEVPSIPLSEDDYNGGENNV